MSISVNPTPLSPTSSSQPQQSPSSPKIMSFISSTNNSTTSLFQHLKKNAISSMPMVKQQSMTALNDSTHPSLNKQERQDMGPSIHATSLDSNIWPTQKQSNIEEDPITLFPLETTQSSPLPFTTYHPNQSHVELDRPLSSSTLSLNTKKNNTNITPTVITARRRTTTPDLGHLDPEEQAALEAEITARRQARRLSRRNMSYYEQDDQLQNEYDDERVMIGTRVSEGHRNYQLM